MSRALQVGHVLLWCFFPHTPFLPYLLYRWASQYYILSVLCLLWWKYVSPLTSASVWDFIAVYFVLLVVCPNRAKTSIRTFGEAIYTYGPFKTPLSAAMYIVLLILQCFLWIQLYRAGSYDRLYDTDSYESLSRGTLAYQFASESVVLVCLWMDNKKTEAKQEQVAAWTRLEGALWILGLILVQVLKSA